METTPDTRPCARCGRPAPRYVHRSDYDRFYCKACRHTTTVTHPQADPHTRLQGFVDRMFLSEGMR